MKKLQKMSKKVLSLILLSSMILSIFVLTTAAGTAPGEDDPIDQFVVRLFNIALDREPTTREFNRLTRNIRNGSYGSFSVARAAFLTPEFERLNVSNEEFVEKLHLAFLDESDVNTQDGVSLIEALEGTSRTRVVRRFLALPRVAASFRAMIPVVEEEEQPVVTEATQVPDETQTSQESAATETSQESADTQTSGVTDDMRTNRRTSRVTTDTETNRVPATTEDITIPETRDETPTEADGLQTSAMQGINAVGGDIQGGILAVSLKPGAPVKYVATMYSVTYDTITVNAATLEGETDQIIEYAISTDDAIEPLEGWQSGLTFGGLGPDREYFVWARSAQNATHYAGEATASEGITTETKGTNGAAVATPATMYSVTYDTITVNAATLEGETDQYIEYAISMDGTIAPTSDWQSGLTFDGLDPNTEYFVWARSKQSNTHDTGTAVASYGITTARAPGAEVITPPTANQLTYNSITVHAAALVGNTGQSVEYAISTNGAIAPTSGWQSGLTFGGLNPNTVYFVWARSAQSNTHDVGTAVASLGIRTEQYWVPNGRIQLAPGSSTQQARIAMLWNAIADANVRGISDRPEHIAGIIGNLMSEAGPALSPFQQEIGHAHGLGLMQWSFARRTALENFMWANGICRVAFEHEMNRSVLSTHLPCPHPPAFFEQVMRVQVRFMFHEMTSTWERFYLNFVDFPTNQTGIPGARSYAELFCVLSLRPARHRVNGNVVINVEDPGVVRALHTAVGGAWRNREPSFSNMGTRRSNAERVYNQFLRMPMMVAGVPSASSQQLPPPVNNPPPAVINIPPPVNNPPSPVNNPPPLVNNPPTQSTVTQQQSGQTVQRNQQTGAVQSGITSQNALQTTQGRQLQSALTQSGLTAQAGRTTQPFSNDLSQSGLTDTIGQAQTAGTQFGRTTVLGSADITAPSYRDGAPPTSAENPLLQPQPTVRLIPATESQYSDDVDQEEGTNYEVGPSAAPSQSSGDVNGNVGTEAVHSAEVVNDDNAEYASFDGPGESTQAVESRQGATVFVRSIVERIASFFEMLTGSRWRV